MAYSKIISGANAKIYINNRPFGLATSFSVDVDVSREPEYGIDQLEAFELTPGRISVNGQIQYIKRRMDGGLTGRGFAAPLDRLALEKYISITLIDRLTDKIVFKIDRAAISKHSLSGEARSILRGNFVFSGIYFADESEF